SLREAAAVCRGCHLWRPATQTVFGEGMKRSKVMFVGEQPGDREDREGKPFVGPAGRELDKALEAVGIDRRDVYITNVVKHFSFEERGKRRLHKTPKRFEIDACRPWLDAELQSIDPEALRALYTESANGRPPGRTVALLPVMGPRSVLLLEGRDHLARRRLMLPSYHGERVQAYDVVMREIAEREVDSWSPGEPFAL